MALSIVTQNNDDGLMHGLPEDFGWRTHDRGNTPPARNGTMIRIGCPRPGVSSRCEAVNHHYQTVTRKVPKDRAQR